MSIARVLPLLLLVACGSDRDRSFACTLDVKPAVRVRLTNAATGQPLAGATAVLRDGAFVETMQEHVPANYTGAAERKGTYDLTITKTGFMTHVTRGIVVTADRCHVSTREFDIALQPIPMLVILLQDEWYILHPGESWR